MYIRSNVYHVFMQQYPDAHFVTVYHENGRVSEIASGKREGKVEVVFVGTYEATWCLVVESRITEDPWGLPETLCSAGPMHYYSLGAERAMTHANSPICSKR